MKWRRRHWPWWIGVMATLLFWLARAWLPDPQPVVSGEPFQAVVVGVVDGDTLDLTGQRVRLYGVDAPEKGQPYGVPAIACLSTLVVGRTVTVEPMGTDPYGRLLAVLWVEGQDINAALVAQGCAWAYPGTGEAYRDEEAQARAQGLGLWAQPNPIPPWEWRK